ncbi:MAG: prolyl oligopeptidase family serine peptidase [Acidobacteriota bacterium]
MPTIVILIFDQVFRNYLIVLILTILLLAGPVSAQEETSAQSVYRLPPKVIVDLVDAPLTPAVSLSPNREWMLLLKRASLAPISEFAQPELRLAGLRINPRTYGKSLAPYFIKMALLRIADQNEKQIGGLPENARISNVQWSPDNRSIAFTLTTDTGIELWIADLQTYQARRLTAGRLNDVYYGSPFVWLSDSKSLVAKFVPDNLGPLPTMTMVPSGPIIQESLGKKAPSRIYPDLLKNPYDEALFEYYTSVQLARISLDGQYTLLGSPTQVTGFFPSPDSKYLLVYSTHRPYSYLVEPGFFPTKIEIWQSDGKLFRQMVDLPLRDDIPSSTFNSAPKGPRTFGWRTDAPATLYWVEAQDGGDPNVKADIRDRVYMLSAPFNGTPITLASLELRFRSIDWGSDNVALINEFWVKTRKFRRWLVQPGSPTNPPRLIFDINTEDHYNHPGNPVMQRAPNGDPLLLTTNNDKAIFLIGNGGSPQGDRPFLDKFDLETKKVERLWRCEAPYYELPVVLLDKTGTHMLTSRESENEQPNYFLRDLNTNKLEQLTHFSHPTAQLANIEKELIHYKRADGIDLTATLYLPAGYTTEKGPLPMVVWAYPEDFKSADAASQVTESPYRFNYIYWGGPLFLLTQGYAVLDHPKIPIIGEGDKAPNDTYIKQLIASAEAAVNEVVRRGVADPDKIAIAGHSYGAFMTTNLLAHTDLFRAGIARSGAYNRTLTPFGFQREERSLWEAPEVYFNMSPFNHAHKINEPILLIHGEADDNPGSFPIQSERLYQAIRGLGGIARLVILPYEKHSYRARESVLHVLWEMTEWLDKHVKNAPPREPAKK